MLGEEGNDSMYGDMGNDRMFGMKGGDQIWDGDGKDSMWGGNDGDLLLGGADNDLLIGDLPSEAGNDKLYGETGDDRLFDAQGDDHLDAGSDVDSCYDDIGANTVINGEESVPVSVPAKDEAGMLLASSRWSQTSTTALMWQSPTATWLQTRASPKWATTM
jgi:hypothetical protein